MRKVWLSRADISGLLLVFMRRTWLHFIECAPTAVDQNGLVGAESRR